MLDRAGDNVPSVLTHGMRHTANCQIVRFGRAAGKHDVFGTRADQGGNLFARRHHGGMRVLTVYMRGRRITEVFPQIGQHRLDDARIDRRGGVVIQIDG